MQHTLNGQPSSPYTLRVDYCDRAKFYAVDHGADAWITDYRPGKPSQAKTRIIGASKSGTVIRTDDGDYRVDKVTFHGTRVYPTFENVA
jgi:hypothetical protein